MSMVGGCCHIYLHYLPHLALSAGNLENTLCLYRRKDPLGGANMYRGHRDLAAHLSPFQETGAPFLGLCGLGPPVHRLHCGYYFAPGITGRTASFSGIWFSELSDIQVFEG